jgi:hypothetical protein
VEEQYLKGFQTGNEMTWTGCDTEDSISVNTAENILAPQKARFEDVHTKKLNGAFPYLL